MAAKSDGNFYNVLMVMALLVIIMAGMKAAQALVVPFLLAGFISIIFASPMVWLKRKGCPSWLSLLVVLAGVLVLCLMAGLFLTVSAADFSQAMPEYQEKLLNISKMISKHLHAVGIKISSDFLDQYINPATLLRYSAQFLNDLGSTLANGALIMFTVILILLEASSLPRKLEKIFKNPEQGQKRVARIMEDIQTYMAMKTIVSLCTGTLVLVFLYFLDVDFFYLWGFIAFLLNYIPNIGSIIAAVPAVIVALIDQGGATAGTAAIFYVVVNVAVGSFIEPMLMGRKVNLSTLVVFISLVFWGWLLGPIGMFLSVPLTMIVKIALETDDQAKWVAVLLGT